MKCLPSKLTAIGFDLDGTLYPRNAHFMTIMNAWFVEAEIPIPVDELKVRDGGGHESRTQFFKWLGSLLNEQPDLLWERFKRDIVKAITPQVEAAHILAELQIMGYTIALLSNGSSKLQRAKLVATQLNKFFSPEAILISEELATKKPDPMCFRKLSEVLHSSPENILYVGDHLKKDVQGALSAGLQACWLNEDAATTTPEGVFRIAALPELLTLLCK